MNLTTDSRVAEAAERLGLNQLETAVLALVAAPELDGRYGPATPCMLAGAWERARARRSIVR